MNDDMGNVAFPLFDGERNMICPVCAHINIHFDEVALVNAHTGIALIASGEDERVKIEIYSTEGMEEVGRRHAIVIFCWCEGCGVRFLVHLRQHKGMTYYATVPLELPEDDDDDRGGVILSFPFPKASEN